MCVYNITFYVIWLESFWLGIAKFLDSVVVFLFCLISQLLLLFIFLGCFLNFDCILSRVSVTCKLTKGPSFYGLWRSAALMILLTKLFIEFLFRVNTIHPVYFIRDAHLALQGLGESNVHNLSLFLERLFPMNKSMTYKSQWRLLRP